MAYTTGDTILDDEYNTFAVGGADGTESGDTNINLGRLYGDHTEGATGGTFGYGQSGEPTAVAAGATVTATQWASLLNIMNTCADHQGTSITAITNPTVGDTIEALSDLQTNLNSLKTNRGDAAAVGSNITTGGSISRTSAWGGAAQTDGLRHTITITFPSNDQLRYFFNCGGLIKVTSSRSGGSSTDKNTGWSNLLTAIGTVVIKGSGTFDQTNNTIAGTTYQGVTKIGGSGSPTTLNATQGVYQNTVAGGFTEVFDQYDTTAQYTSNHVEIHTERTSATVFKIQVDYHDDADADTDESVDGTLTTTVTLTQPSTTYLTNTWGTPSMSAAETTF